MALIILNRGKIINLIPIIHHTLPPLIMQRSNIFAYIELSNFVDELAVDPNERPSSLLALHAYFNLIPSNMLSEELASEWDDICRIVSRSGPSLDANGRVIANAVKNTIKQMTRDECLAIVERVIELRQRVAVDF